jgi:hypothetical protein
MLTTEELAMGMYADYGATTDYKNYQGLPMPEWHELTDRIRAAWCAAATGAARRLQAELAPV